MDIKDAGRVFSYSESILDDVEALAVPTVFLPVSVPSFDPWDEVDAREETFTADDGEMALSNDFDGLDDETPSTLPQWRWNLIQHRKFCGHSFTAILLIRSGQFIRQFLDQFL